MKIPGIWSSMVKHFPKALEWRREPSGSSKWSRQEAGCWRRPDLEISPQQRCRVASAKTETAEGSCRRSRRFEEGGKRPRHESQGIVEVVFFQRGFRACIEGNCNVKRYSLMGGFISCQLLLNYSLINRRDFPDRRAKQEDGGSDSQGVRHGLASREELGVEPRFQGHPKSFGRLLQQLPEAARCASVRWQGRRGCSDWWDVPGMSSLLYCCKTVIKLSAKFII